MKKYRLEKNSKKLGGCLSGRRLRTFLKAYYTSTTIWPVKQTKDIYD